MVAKMLAPGTSARLKRETLDSNHATAEKSRHAGSGRRTRRLRNPEGTREAILEAAREVLAQDGKEGLSVARVAQRAGVNRGTAYQHFQTREQLIEATAAWVSEKLYQRSLRRPGSCSRSAGRNHQRGDPHLSPRSVRDGKPGAGTCVAIRASELPTTRQRSFLAAIRVELRADLPRRSSRNRESMPRSLRC